MYCDNCDSLLNHKTQEDGSVIFVCPDCEYSEENTAAYNNSFTLSEKIAHDKQKVEIVDGVANETISSEIREELREQYREAMSSLE